MAAPTNTISRWPYLVAFTIFKFWSACFSFLFLNCQWSYLFVWIFPPFFVNIFIFYVNIWIVNVCTECVVGMYFKKECIRVWNYGVEAIFFIYIGNYIILFMFVLLHCYRFLFFWFLGWRPQLFTSFVLSCSSLSSWRRRVHAAILKKPISNLQMSSLQSLSDALMPKVMYIVWTTFKVLSLFRSVFVTESV